jgi:hypothetical protein
MHDIAQTVHAIGYAFLNLWNNPEEEYELSYAAIPAVCSFYNCVQNRQTELIKLILNVAVIITANVGQRLSTDGARDRRMTRIPRLYFFSLCSSPYRAVGLSYPGQQAPRNLSPIC